jgi:hypothetical protein
MGSLRLRILFGAQSISGLMPKKLKSQMVINRLRAKYPGTWKWYPISGRWIKTNAFPENRMIVTARGYPLCNVKFYMIRGNSETEEEINLFPENVVL